MTWRETFARWRKPKPSSGLLAARAEVRAPARVLAGLTEPTRFLTGCEWLHESMEDLFGVPPGGQRLILALEHGDYGALWAYMHGGPGHHIGIPPVSWPNLIAAANRRMMVSALVHEVGHMAFAWDLEPRSGQPYMRWGAATEGLATPTGTYACERHGCVPAWIDFPAGDRDWDTLQAWAFQWIRQGLDVRAAGALGQDGTESDGHGPGAAILEAVCFDLFFRLPVGYAAYRTVCRQAVTHRSPAAAARSERQKQDDFFVTLGQASRYDLAPYLAAWGYDTHFIAPALAAYPALPVVSYDF